MTISASESPLLKAGLVKNVGVLLVMVGVLFLPRSSHAQTTAIVNGTVIDGTGAAPKPNSVILIEGKKITAVGAKKQVSVSPNSRIIDAAGKYVIPGLIDTNVHLVLAVASLMPPELLGKYEDRLDQIAAEAAQISLKNGVTTVFDSWGPLQPLLNVRDRIRRGELIGSRVFVAGNIVGLSGPLGRDFMNATQMSVLSPAFATRINKMWEQNVGPELLDDSPEEVRAEIRKYIGRGIDFMKFAASAHPNQRGRGDWLIFSPEVAKIIVEEGHKAGIIVQTHTTTIESLRLALLAGIDMGQHPESVGAHDLPDDLVKMIVDRSVYCGVISYTKDYVAAEKEIWEMTGGKSTRWPPTILDHWQGVNIPKLIRAGALITMESDGGTRDPDTASYPSVRLSKIDPTVFGEAHFFWLEAMVEKGMTPMNAIVSSTKNGAAAYHHLEQFGTLEPGKFADLVILDADPLENISNVRKIALVMKEGSTVDRDRLPEQRVLTK
jgi:imidazolonepropionase-like amidohydrolase